MDVRMRLTCVSLKKKVLEMDMVVTLPETNIAPKNDGFQ